MHNIEHLNTCVKICLAVFDTLGKNELITYFILRLLNSLTFFDV